MRWPGMQAGGAAHWAGPQQAARFPRVVAVEPDHAMRRLLAASGQASRVIAGSGEQAPLANASVDAVFIAEAFHLFATAQVVGEIARALRPAGTLVLLWNLPAGLAEPSIAAVARLLAERGPTRREAGHDPDDLDPARYASGEWRQAFAGSPFGQFQQGRVPDPQLIDREGLVAFLASGLDPSLPGADRAALLGRIRSLLPAPGYRRPWETHLHWARLG